MDYEKKYKEMKARVLEIGRGYVKGVDFSKPRQIAEYIDPELKESEDANIRGAIIDYLKDNNLTEWAAWLEKQGEPKSTSWKPTKEQYGALDYAFNCCPDTELGNYFEGVLSNLIDELHKLENQSEQVAIATMDEKPLEEHEPVKVEYNITGIGSKHAEGKLGEMIKNLKPTWSEEDEQLIDEVAVCLRKYEEQVQGGYSKFYVQSLADRIESLRPGNTCKATGWSEEDEDMFNGVIETEQYMLDVVYGRKIFAVGNEDLKEECTKELAWLKSLKDRIK